MPVGDTDESKAQKLAAARKKLREYQKRSSADTAASATATNTTESHTSSIGGGSSISSNISEASDCESSTNGLDVANPNAASSVVVTENLSETTTTAPTADVAASTAIVPSKSASEPAPPTTASYFQQFSQDASTTQTILGNFSKPATKTAANDEIKDLAASVIVDPVQQHQNVNTIQVLITEKATLTTELNKYRHQCRERELEAEELRTQLEAITRRQDDLLQRHQTQQQSMEQLRNTNADLQHKLAQSNAKQEDQAAHMDELKRLLDVIQQRATEMEHEYKEKTNELEMAQLRIRQLSDEASVIQSSDNRVETLTQTQFMYEQQIRDLQAMVQQLTYDKEQANSQYQSYAQHLNAEIRNLNEKNSELMDEFTKQQERERQLVDHISALEKDIQKDMQNRQEQMKKEKEQASSTNTESAHTDALEKFKEQISDYEMERHEFQLKIKSQEDRLEQLTNELKEKETKLQQLEEYVQSYSAQQPDQSKLLATMESDKIAASRALTQNMELKKQLDELELRFVQLTNDKAELMNKLDAEEHANRKMRESYAAMEEQVQNIDKRFKFKDEEMIRLSHENMELSNKVAVLEKRLERTQQGRGINKDLSAAGDHESYDHITNEMHEHTEHEEHNHEHVGYAEHGDGEGGQHKHNGYGDECSHANERDHHHDHQCTHEHEDTHENEQQYLIHDHTYHRHQHEHAENRSKKFSTTSSNTSTPHLPTDEAVEKLEQRFTRLMLQVADLTDEKQRLEHLVLQLQGETETIGEYITLYQTQRRMLKQREYEKAAQMQLLQREREQLRERIALLNNLVSCLSADIPQRLPIPENLNAVLADCNNSAAASTSGTAGNAENANDNVDTVPIAAEASEVFLGADQTHQDAQQQTDIGHSHEKLTAAESRQILSKIQDIISEINENSQRIPDVGATAQTVDHLNCCLGKIEVV